MARATIGAGNAPLPNPTKLKSKTRATVTVAGVARPRVSKSTTNRTAIDLSLSAYLRTDPLNALTVLMKLIDSLPARMGGAAYKLTPAEHALVVHLVSILDPYVYAGARVLSPRKDAGMGLGLLDMPTELLDVIVGHVESRTDVGRVGLVCKRLAGVVFPRHFEYRVVRTKASALSVWHHLAVHRSLAGNVRTLEILDERLPTSGSSSTALVPRGILPGEKDTDLESTDDGLARHAKHERFLLRALPHLSGLRSFKWAAVHSPVGIDKIWDVLARQGGLKEIEVWDNSMFGPAKDEEEDTLIPLTLERVIFRATPHAYGASKTPQLTRIAAILHKCANLKDLEIIYTVPRVRPTAGAGPVIPPARLKPLADELLTFGRWAGLTRVTLANIRVSDSELLIQFLAAHDQLEAVKVDVAINSGSSIAGETLPRLRELHGSNGLISAILGDALRNEALRPLNSVAGFSLGSIYTSSSSSTDAHILSLLQKHLSLTSVSLSSWTDMDDIRRLAAAVPGVRELTIGPRRTANGSSSTRDKSSASGAGPVSNAHEWMEVLATLPVLTMLRGVKFFYEVGGDAADSVLGNYSPSSSTGVQTTSSAPNASQKNLSAMARSRLRKNDEIAGLLAWRCPKLRRVDHWDTNAGKEIVLLRDGSGGRWEVRKAKA